MSRIDINFVLLQAQAGRHFLTGVMRIKIRADGYVHIQKDSTGIQWIYSGSRRPGFQDEHMACTQVRMRSICMRACVRGLFISSTF